MGFPITGILPYRKNAGRQTACKLSLAASNPSALSRLAGNKAFPDPEAFFMLTGEPSAEPASAVSPFPFFRAPFPPLSNDETSHFTARCLPDPINRLRGRLATLDGTPA